MAMNSGTKRLSNNAYYYLGNQQTCKKSMMRFSSLFYADSRISRSTKLLLKES